MKMKYAITTALALAMASCAVAPAIAGPDEAVCEGLAGLAMSGAALGQTMELLDPAIDLIVENSLTLEDAAPMVAVLVSGYAQGVLGVDPDAVGMEAFTACMSEPV